MRNVVSLVVLPAVLLFSPLLFAQTSSPASPPGWLPCPRCQSGQERVQARQKYEVDKKSFDPHDLNGIWGNNGVELRVNISTGCCGDVNRSSPRSRSGLKTMIGTPRFETSRSVVNMRG